MPYEYRRAETAEEEVDIDLQELQVADYLVFLLALETYMGWLEETVGSIPAGDVLLQRGIALARMAERQNLDTIAAFIKSNLVSPASVKLLEAAIRPPPTPAGLAVRATKLRTVLSKGGTSTTKAVFGTSTKARREVQEAIDASMIDDPDAALNKFSALVLRNKKLEKWIDEASDAVPGAVVASPVQEATKATTEASTSLLTSQVQQEAKPGTDQSIASRNKHAETLAAVEQQATDAAKKVLDRTEVEDRPLTRSEVIGVATATATAVASDPDNPQNVPVSLQRLDPEQRVAAMTGGKVRVSAGAGSGKSTTLLARTQYLIDQGAVPNRMMAMSFNKKAADELAVKMASKIGSDKVSTKNSNPNGVLVGTMHSTFLKFINQFGTPAQVNVFAKVRDDKGKERGGMVNAGSITKSVKAIWDECFANIDKNPPGDPDGSKRVVPDDELWKMPPKSKRMTAYMNVFQGDGMSLEQAKAWAAERGTIEADQAIKFYEVYEGLKGSLGKGWRPNLCGDNKPSPTFDKFVDFNRGGKPRVGDFNDMLSIFRDIMRANPAAKQKVQEQFDHVMVDECVHEDSLVRTEAGTDKPVREVQPGESIQSYENGCLVYKPILDKKRSSKATGYKIRTVSGYELDMTAEHRLYATAPEIAPEGEAYLYLMYRKDLGFRIGTSKCPARRVGSRQPRSAQERADCLWVIDRGSVDEVAFLEQSYSLQYGIPTQVFEGVVRGLNQDRIDRIFAVYGENGRKLMEEKGLHFDYPNWINTTATTDRINRVTVNLNAHRRASEGVNRYGGNAVNFSYTGEMPGLGLDNVYDTKGGRKLFTQKVRSYTDARRIAMEVAEKTGGRIRDTLSLEGEDCLLVTASALHPGMKVPVTTLDGVVLDTIEEITVSSGVYYDLAVQDSANFFANGVLSHNCQDLNPLQFEVLQHLTGHVETDDPKRSFWMVGDDKQCCHVDTPVSTPDGMRRAGDLQAGDVVLAFRNGKVVPQTVKHVLPSAWEDGIKLTTESGKTLTVSPNHKIWASSPELKKGEKIVYLMYRPDLGFRVGITNKCEGGYNPFGRRTATEQAERLWILATADDTESALLAEATFSLTYGVPMAVFNGESRGINQDRLNQLFAKFGKNGGRILEALHLSFDLPNWTATSYSKGTVRRTIQMVSHTGSGTQVALEWTGRDLDETLEGVPYIKLDGGRNRLRKWFTSYRQALVFAEGLQSKTKANLRRRIATADEAIPLITAGGLLPGMSVLVEDGEAVAKEKIVSIENVPGSFVDLDIDDASNFFGGGILSHNCIYQFRGAEPNNFIKLDKMGFKDRQITTNYRCAPEFIDAANKLIANNKNQIPMEAKAEENRARGEANLTVETPDTPAQAAAIFGQKILAGLAAGEPLSNFAVLARTNGELGVYQQVCATVGIPFVQKKAAAVFSSQETESFRAFLQSVMSKDPKVLQSTFGQVMLSGGLHTIKGGGSEKTEATKAFNAQVKRSIAAYCQKNRLPLADFDPINEANANPDFLASILKDVSGKPEWAARKDADNGAPLMEGISLLREHMTETAGKKDDAGNPAFNTKQLFEAILELPVYEVKPPGPGSDQWVRRHTTLRKSTEERLAARVAQEDADKDVELEDVEKAHLGTLDFVQLMMEPSAAEPQYNPLDPEQFHAKFEGLADRAEELRIDPDEWEKKQDRAGVQLADRKPPPGVYLGTVHSTKGAEWNDVTVLMPKGLFPMERKPRKPADNEVPEEAIYDATSERESERRLGYVALTRPKKSLTIMCPGGISDFVREAGLHQGQNVPRPETETPGAVPATPGEVDVAMAAEQASEGSVEEPPEWSEQDQADLEGGGPPSIPYNEHTAGPSDWRLASTREPLQNLQGVLGRQLSIKYNYNRGAS